MPFLIAAVVLVGVLCAADLILTVGVIRRLRDHAERLALLSGEGGIAVGDEVGEFSVATVDGRLVVTRDALSEDAGGTVVAFFSPDCEPCEETLSRFVPYAAELRAGGCPVLAAVVGDPGEQTDAFVAALSPVAHVVAERHPDGPLSAAFRIGAVPTVLRVAPDATGRVVVTDADVRLDTSAAAAA
ncbi:redoxin domain-containing protein [Streptomyces olivaceiscleroticus]|uniref:TlpA family protein n=1 Tax=Streptomyces olivaceiscleroticus TaxID=68245 RepID=A0ABN1A072_9ACTN